MLFKGKFNLNALWIMGFAFVLWAAGPSLAEDVKGEWDIGTGLGVSLPGGRSNDLQAPGASVYATVEKHMTNAWTLGLETGHFIGQRIEGDLFFDYDNDGTKDNFTVAGDRNRKVTYITPTYKWASSTDWGVDGIRWLRSYLLVGVGLYHGYNSQGNLVVKQGITSTGIDMAGVVFPIKERTNNNFGFNLGFGFGVRVFKNNRIGLDMRYHRIVRPPEDEDYWNPSFRIAHIF